MEPLALRHLGIHFSRHLLYLFPKSRRESLDLLGQLIQKRPKIRVIECVG
jgi:hypothetical protein